MISARRPILLALLMLPVAAQAQAQTRTFTVGSFERVRVDGPFEVAVTTGRGPHASAEGDAGLLDRLEVAVEGGTLVVRLGAGGWGERPATAASAPLVVTLSTPSLAGATVNADGHLSVTRMTGDRVDLAVNGAGAIDVADAQADRLAATVVGTGSIGVGGHAMHARLISNGAGAIDAGKLAADDLVVEQAGTGQTVAAARYSAQVTTTGLGRVRVLGRAKCTVHALGGGPVACGAGG